MRQRNEAVKCLFISAIPSLRFTRESMGSLIPVGPLKRIGIICLLHHLSYRRGSRQSLFKVFKYRLGNPLRLRLQERLFLFSATLPKPVFPKRTIGGKGGTSINQKEKVI